MPAPLIQLSTTSQFDFIWDDKSSGANMDATFYRPTPNEGFIMGDFPQTGHTDPSGTVFIISGVENDDSNNPALAAPIGFTQIWNSHNSNSKVKGAFWAPTAPDGYFSLGHIAVGGTWDEPKVSDIPSYRCMRTDLVSPGSLGALVWSSHNSGANEKVLVYPISILNVMVGWPSFDPPSLTVFVPKALSS